MTVPDNGVWTGREPSDSEDLAVGERSVTHGPPPPPDNGVRPGRELPQSAESATAPRLMSLVFIGYPHVAGIAALAVNVRIYELQPLTRLIALITNRL